MTPPPGVVCRGLRIAAGFLLIVLGILALPLPGPFTTPPVLAGLALLSKDFPVAHRIIQMLRDGIGRVQLWWRTRRR